MVEFSFIRAVMDSLREFLETSTIHGLSHIASSPSKVSKCLWSLVVVAGFTIAVTLINNSYTDWQASPILTSISTHPLSELDFPKVTVCPPKGSNTALNYDLMRVSNVTLTQDDRERLSQRAQDIFLTEPHIKYVDKMGAIINLHNYRNVYEGYQSFPVYGEATYLSALHGSISSPRFRQGHNTEISNERQHLVYVIEAPEGFLGSLLINITTETSEDPSVLDQVEYTVGSKYRYFSEEKSWDDAEAHCVSQGGHLASVWSRTDIDEVLGLINSTWLTIGHGNSVWLGGLSTPEQKEWQWIDGSPWSLHSLIPTNGEKGECTLCSIGGEVHGTESCGQKVPFVCSFPTTVLKGSDTNNMSFEIDNGGLSKVFTLYWSFKPKRKSKPTKATSGFSMDWQFTEKTSKFILDTSEISGYIATPSTSTNADFEYKFLWLSPTNISKLLEPNTTLIFVLNTTIRDTIKGVKVVEVTVMKQKYTFHPLITASWSDAEQYCANSGQHLASFQSEEELEAVVAASRGTPIWVGGHKDSDGVWTWTDGTPWTFTKGPLSTSSHSACTYLTLGPSSDMKNTICRKKKTFLCQNNNNTRKQVLNESQSVSLRFKQEDLYQSLSLKIEMKINVALQDLPKGNMNVLQSGYEVKWFSEYLTNNQTKKNISVNVKQWNENTQSSPKYLKLNKYLIRIVNLKLDETKNTKFILNRKKEKYVSDKGKYCANGQLLDVAQDILIVGGDFTRKLNIGDKVLKRGVDMFLLSIYCPDQKALTDAIKLTTFYQALIKTHKSETIVQATLNNMKLKLHPDNKKALGNFYIELDSHFNFSLPDILSSLMSLSDLEMIKGNYAPIFWKQNEERKICGQNVTCKWMPEKPGNISVKKNILIFTSFSVFERLQNVPQA